MRVFRTPTWLGLALLTCLACGEDSVLLEIEEPGTCEPAFECELGLEYRRGECRSARCQADADCCPSQTCITALGLCADQTTACTSDADCFEIPGQTCIDFRGGQFCGYPNATGALTAAGTQSCESSLDCGPGRSCVGHRCVQFAPCEGGCPSGQICDIDTNLCFEEASCDRTCGAGEILVVADPDLMSGPQCCAVECTCSPLPNVQNGEFGWFTDLAADPQQLVAAGYDPFYGDLVVGRYDDQGALIRLDYVDGFPMDGPIVGNPTGPRGGRTEPGDDVGEHTSVAIDSAGGIHVAYYDRTRGRLKYAFGIDEQWMVSVVDEAAHVGLYTSIAIGPDDRPRIAYMMAEGTADPDPTPRSGLKVATALTSQPTATSDWFVELIDSRPLPRPCDGVCTQDELCTDLGLEVPPSCQPVVAITLCDDLCSANERCVDVDDVGFRCAETFVPPADDDFLPGVGLFASLAVTSTGAAVVAYYDRIDGDLRLARSFGESYSVRVLDGRDPSDRTAPGPDVGQHASVAVGPGDRIAVAYFDATDDDLVYFDLTDGIRTVVDDGVSPPDLRFVGADADLVFDPTGEPTIAYQDPTSIDLLFALRRQGIWSTEVIRGQTPATASGFYATQAHRGTTAFIGGVDLSLDHDLQLQLIVTPRPF